MDKDVLDSIDALSDIKKLSKSIGKSSRSVRNRLCSIAYDNMFISSQIDPIYDHRPIVPNMRCGLWYVRPSQRTEYCYFKSTDGHNTQWDFSIKRLNFNLLPIIMDHNGIVIVDSTRRGKKMPDSLSKTVPIWCCCINAMMFGTIELFLPPGTVSQMEYDSILKKIPQFLERIKAMKIMDNIVLDKPLRPLWVYPGSVPYEPLKRCENFHPIICCTASMQYQDGELHLRDFEYVQGAADDHELWAPHHGFTDEMFWKNIDTFEELTNDNAINNLILKLVEEKKLQTTESEVNEIMQFEKTRFSNGRIINKIDSLPDCLKQYDKIVIFTNTYETDFLKQSHYEGPLSNGKVIFYPFGANKKYHKSFRNILRSLVDRLHTTKGKIIVLCENGQDFSIGVILCLISLEYDLNWEKSENHLLTKNFVKSQLIRIMNQRQCNPQRNILNSCNSILM